MALLLRSFEAHLIEDIASEAMDTANKELNMNVKFSYDLKIGKNYAEIH